VLLCPRKGLGRQWVWDLCTAQAASCSRMVSSFVPLAGQAGVSGSYTCAAPGVLEGGACGLCGWLCRRSWIRRRCGERASIHKGGAPAFMDSRRIRCRTLSLRCWVSGVCVTGTVTLSLTLTVCVCVHVRFSEMSGSGGWVCAQLDGTTGGTP
jgi:hypothetical protein